MADLFINEVSVRLNERIILDKISCSFSNMITCIIGDNGSGKTTLLKVISGLLRNECGIIQFNNEKQNIYSARWRNKIGYLPQNPNLYERMDVFSFLDYMLLLSGWRNKNKRHARIAEISEALNLVRYWNQIIGILSGGTKQKVAIAQALIHDPPIILLDEPTNSLDNEERENFHRYLVGISADKIVLFVGHIVNELPVICRRLLVLKKGRFIYDGSCEDLINENKKFVVELTVPNSNSISLTDYKGILSFRSKNGSFILRVDKRFSNDITGTEVLPTLSEAVRALNYTLKE